MKKSKLEKALESNGALQTEVDFLKMEISHLRDRLEVCKIGSVTYVLMSRKEGETSVTVEGVYSSINKLLTQASFQLNHEYQIVGKNVDRPDSGVHQTAFRPVYSTNWIHAHHAIINELQESGLI